ncbi:MAG: hypothetical protein EBR30_01190 [Cytophagia bacterium]|jgi:hypothetical protein|nr:hypothetical protein [Cytophagia bacterium]
MTYKLLAEKYNKILKETNSEDEDLLAGVNYLTSINLEMINVIGHILGINFKNDPDYYKGDVDYFLNKWFEYTNSDIAFDAGITDDNLPDYEAGADEIGDRMSRSLDNAYYIYNNHPEIKAKYAPNLTYEDANNYLTAYLENYI